MARSPKRPREISVPSVDIEPSLQALREALTTKARVAAIRDIKSLCIDTHENCHIVSAFLGEGVLQILQLQLNYVLRRHGSLLQELAQLCDLFGFFLQQAILLKLSWEDEVDGPELLELLSDALSRGERDCIISLLHFLSSSAEGTHFILRSRSLMFRLVLQLRETDSPAFLDLLGTWKNLTCFNDENVCCLFDLPGFVDALVAIPVRRLSQKGAERISSVLRNLAIYRCNRDKMLQNTSILNTVEQLAMLEDSQVQRNLVKSLISLALERNSCVLLLFFGDGLLLKKTKMWLTNYDPEMRKQAARLTRLWGSDAAAGIILINDKEMMDTLSHLAIRDVDREVRQEAAKAFSACADQVKSPMPQHEAVVQALIHMAQSSDLPPQIIAKTLCNQSKFQSNRLILAQRIELLHYLSNLAMNPMASDDACCAIANISSDEQTLPFLAIPAILKALSFNLAHSTEIPSDRVKHSMIAVNNLSRDPTIRLNLVRQNGLLASLIKTASMTSTEEKAKVKETIITLINDI